MRRNMEWEQELANIESDEVMESDEAMDALKTHLTTCIKERNRAVAQVEALTKTLNDMRAEANAQKKFIAQLVSQKVSAEMASTTLLMNMNASMAHLKKAIQGGDRIIGVHELQQRLEEADVMIDAHKASIAELVEDNKQLRIENEEIKRFGVEYENLRLEYESIQQENEDLKNHLNAANGDNTILRMQIEEMERFWLEYENLSLEYVKLQSENEDLKKKLAVAGGEEFAMLADFLQSNEMNENEP